MRGTYMEYRTMFSPVKIGTVQIPNRFATPPMGNNFANTDGTLSERSKAYYAARAKGGFGLVTIDPQWSTAKPRAVRESRVSFPTIR